MHGCQKDENVSIACRIRIYYQNKKRHAIPPIVSILTLFCVLHKYEKNLPFGQSSSSAVFQINRQRIPFRLFSFLPICMSYVSLTTMGERKKILSIPHGTYKTIYTIKSNNHPSELLSGNHSRRKFH